MESARILRIGGGDAETRKETKLAGAGGLGLTLFGAGIKFAIPEMIVPPIYGISMMVVGGILMLTAAVTWLRSFWAPGERESSPGEIASLSDPQLKKQALRAAQHLRAYGRSFMEEREVQLRDIRERSLHNSVINPFMFEVTREFGNRYRGEARALLDELRKRTGVLPSHSSAIALDHGSLAGVDPIGDAAAELERLARKL